MLLKFGIAGTALEVQGATEWLSPLRMVWAAWTPAAAVVPWSVDVLPAPDFSPPTAPLFETLPRCNGGVCTLLSAGFEGCVDATQGHAYLQAHPHATPADIGYFLRVTLAVQAFARGGLLFHAAGVVHREKGYALFGLSGSGKTTAAQLSAPDPVLNDDLLLLWPDSAGWTMYATPFGKRRGNVLSAPLCAFLRLMKASEVFVVPLPCGRALGELASNTPVMVGDPLCLPEVMARWEGIMRQIPVYALHFRREPTFWEVVDAELG
ncbi:MAG TPA: hypothetical protein PKH77_07130 [Anaerolineae bacterium]|nr:hypothetical protein [Anaerolineae bacterium]